MVLTQRDKFLLLKIQSHGLLTTRQVAAVGFPGVALTTVLRRLRVLEKARYIRRIEGLVSTERAWAVTNRAAEMNDVGPAKLHFPRNSLDHDLKLTELRLLLEECGIAHSWIPEHEIKAKMARARGIRDMSSKIVPDAILGTDIQGLKQSIALELELNFKNRRRYEHIFADYMMKKSLFAVWYVVQTMAMGRHIERAHRSSYGLGPRLFWSLVDDLFEDPEEAEIHCKEGVYSVSDIFVFKDS